jgi:hypothetical protein
MFRQSRRASTGFVAEKPARRLIFSNELGWHPSSHGWFVEFNIVVLAKPAELVAHSVNQLVPLSKGSFSTHKTPLRSTSPVIRLVEIMDAANSIAFVPVFVCLNPFQTDLQ